MRFDEIIITNYRQYKYARFCFPFVTSSDSDIHVMVAKNGVGKTNLLNAINWCLYDDEPHLSGSNGSVGSRKDQLPVFNQDAARELIEKGNSVCEVKVEISASQNGVKYLFERMVRMNVETSTPMGASVLMVRKWENSNLTLYQADEAKELVSRFLPQKIRQYFFFDGEQLLNYFTNSNSSPAHIKDSIYEIAQVNIICEMEKHLQECAKKCDKEISKISPNLESKREAWEAKKLSIIELQNQIDILQCEIDDAEKKIDELNRYINGTESVVEANEKHENNERLIKEEEFKRARALRSLALFVRKYTVQLLLYKINRATHEYIKNSDADNAVAIGTSVDAVRKSLKNSKCEICGSSLDEYGIKHLEELLNRLATTPLAQCLAELKGDIAKSLNIDDYEREKEKLFEGIRQHDERIELLREENARLEETIRTVSQVDDIKQAVAQRDDNKVLVKNNTEKLGRYKFQREGLQEGVKQLRDDYESAIVQNQLCEEHKRKRDFICSAIEHAVNVRTSIVSDVKSRLQEETMQKYKELLWKKNAYERVELDDNFSLKLFNKAKNKSCLGTASAAEKELLALAFTIALHDVSGHDNLLFVDTPVGRVDADNRKNLAEVLLNVGRQRQIILAFTPTEYSDEIRGVLNEQSIASVRTVEMKNGIVKVEEGA